MICPKCQAELPALALACIACMGAEHRTQLEQSEIKVLPQIMSGSLNLKLLKAGGRAQHYHLGFRDGFSTNTYCRAALRSAIVSFKNFADRPDNICPHCTSTLREFLKKAGIPAAR